MTNRGHYKPTLRIIIEDWLPLVKAQPSRESHPVACHYGRPVTGLRQKPSPPSCLGVLALGRSCDSPERLELASLGRCAESHTDLLASPRAARPDGYLAMAAGACGDLDGLPLMCDGRFPLAGLQRGPCGRRLALSL